MAGSEKVEAYFTGVASSYQQASRGRVWGAVRNREAAALLALAGDVAGREVLELGCGAGFYTRLLLESGARHIWAVDLSDAMLAQLPTAGVTPIKADASLADPGRSFDLVVSAGMLEFVADPVAVMANAARHAVPGARLVALIPTCSILGRAYRLFHRRNGLSIRLFNRAELDALAVASGWTLSRMAPAGPYSAAAELTRSNGS
jgi:ubiquinone/menaquinone biosynthesis C-methylase UbiE